MSRNKGKQKNKNTSQVKKSAETHQNINLYFKWDISELAFDFPENVIDNLNTKLLINNIIPALQKCEGKTWRKIENYPDNCFLSIATENGDSLYEKWIKNNKPEYEGYITEIFCFSIGDKKWLLGIKEITIFKVIWYDEGNHNHLSDKSRREKEYFRWDISTIDWDFPDNTKGELNKHILMKEITSKLQQHEQEKWGTMHTHPQHHFVNITKSSKTAPFKRWKQHERFKEIGEYLFSFRLGSRKRLYGYVIGVTFHALWYDHNHDTIYPSQPNNT